MIEKLDSFLETIEDNIFESLLITGVGAFCFWVFAPHTRKSHNDVTLLQEKLDDASRLLERSNKVS